MKTYINCSKCNKYTNNYHLRYCKSCYNYIKLEQKKDILPLKNCECSPNCKTLIPILTMRNKPQKYHRGHKPNNQKYKTIYKPYFKDSNKGGCIAEHRYIMYIYLSILNNKPTYIPKNYDIHHKNKNGLDNRIENLELVDRKTHMVIHNLFNGDNGRRNKKDMSERVCNICKSNNIKRWRTDIEGFICDICTGMVLYYRNKFNLPIIQYTISEVFRKQ